MDSSQRIVATELHCTTLSCQLVTVYIGHLAGGGGEGGGEGGEGGEGEEEKGEMEEKEEKGEKEETPV